jgi:hypothetical protein
LYQLCQREASANLYSNDLEVIARGICKGADPVDADQIL